MLFAMVLRGMFGLCTSSPAGNLVDGLPPAANTGAGEICGPIQPEHCPVFRVLARLVPEMLLFVLNGRFGNFRYIYDLTFHKGASLAMDFSLSWCCPKPRNE